MKLKTTVGWLLAISVSLPTTADVTVSRFSHNGERQTTVFEESAETVRNESTGFMKYESAKTQKTPVNVTVRLSYPENMKPWFIQYGEAVYGPTWDYEGNDVMSIYFTPVEFVPDILLTWFRSDEGKSHGVFTQVDSFTDGMVIDVDAAKAVNKFETTFLKKDGTPFSVARVEYDPEEGTEKVIEDGDISRFFGTSYVSYNDIPYICSQFIIADRTNIKTGVRKISSTPVFYLNELPEGCVFSSNAVGYGTDGVTQYFVQTDCGRTPGVYTNNLQLWSGKEISFMPGRWTQENKGPVECRASIATSLRGHLYESLMLGTSLFQYDPEKTVSINVNTCIPSVSSDSDKVAGIETLYECMLGETVNGEEGSIDSPLFKMYNDSFYQENINILPGGYMSILGDIWQYTPGNRERGWYREHVNTYLPASLSEYSGIYGNTVPIVVTMTPVEEEEPLPEEFFEMLLDMGWINYGYVGRNGEVRIADLFATDVKQSAEDGLYNITVTNSNTLIDGSIIGVNKTELNCVMAAEDWFPPTMQTLMFRDGNGMVTDRLSKRDDSVLEFYAGDFKIKYDEETGLGCMETDPIERVKAEYSPQGSDSWIEIPVAEIPEMFFMPGYGYFYRGSLAGIDDKETDQWYDLRITLTDRTGNCQTQTISPAFNIKSDSGVSGSDGSESIVLINKGGILEIEGCECPEVRVFDMTGYLIVAGSGGKIDVSSVYPGVYMVEVCDGSIRKIFKKLFN